jgi:hypothetical protein
MPRRSHRPKTHPLPRPAGADQNPRMHTPTTRTKLALGVALLASLSVSAHATSVRVGYFRRHNAALAELLAL